MPEQLDLLAGFSRPEAEPQTAAIPMPAPPAAEPEAKAEKPSPKEQNSAKVEGVEENLDSMLGDLLNS